MFNTFLPLLFTSCLFLTGCNIPEHFYEEEALKIVEDLDQEEHKLIDQPEDYHQPVRVITRHTQKQTVQNF